MDTAGNQSGVETVTETPEASASSDLTPPANVSGLAAAGGYGQVILTWTDPTDTDLDSVEITWTPGGTAPQTVAKGTGTYTATGLTGGTAYTFTVKTKDTEGNLSKGTGINATLTGKAQVNVSFGGKAEDQTINLSGVEDLSQEDGDELTVTVNGSFTAYRWFLDGEALAGKTGSSLALKAADLAVKRHELTVFVTAGGVEYAKAVKFTVTN